MENCIRRAMTFLMSAFVLTGLGISYFDAFTTPHASAAVNSAQVKAEAEDNTFFQITEGLKQDNIFLMGDAEIGLEEELREALDGSSIAVVVIPKGETMASYSDPLEEQWEDSCTLGNYFACAIYEDVKEDYDSVIVLSGNKFQVMGGGDGENLASQLEGTNAANVERIILNQDKIEDYSAYERGEWMPIIWIPMLIVLVITLGYQLLFEDSAFRELLYDLASDRRDRKAEKTREAAREQAKREAAKAEADRIRSEAIVQDISKDVPRDLRTKLDQMQKWAAHNIAPHDREFAIEIRTMVERFQILFERIDERGTPQQKRIALVEYSDMLDKISSALSERYYLDILAHPELWEGPEERIAQVKRAVEGCKVQLLENIKQVNGSQDLNFQANLAYLAGFMETPKVKDLYKDTDA